MKFNIEAISSTVADSDKNMILKIELKGNLDNKFVDKFDFLLSSLINGGVRKIIFDIEELLYVDSIGIGKIIEIIKILRKAGGEAVITRYNSNILNIVEPIEMDNFVKFLPGVEEGVNLLDSK